MAGVWVAEVKARDLGAGGKKGLDYYTSYEACTTCDEDVGAVESKTEVERLARRGGC